MIVERQWFKDQTKSKLSTAWLTLGQLEKIYGDVKVAQGIGKNKPPEHIRPHPECPEVEEAKQYLCTLHDHKIRQVEKGTEKGVSFTAEVDASDKDVIKACTDKFAQDTALDNPAAKGLSVADEERQAQIKQERKEKAARNKHRKKRSLAHRSGCHAHAMAERCRKGSRTSGFGHARVQRAHGTRLENSISEKIPQARC